MKRKWLSLFLCLSIIMVMLAGCSSKQNSSNEGFDELETEDIEATVAPTTTDTANASDASEKLITVGFAQIGAESDWRNANTTSMKSTLTKENGFNLIFKDAQQKQENQIQAVKDFISQGVDIIVLAPITETGWDDVLNEAKSAGIPVILVDRMVKVSDESLYSCWLGSNFEKEGVTAANWLTDYLKTQGKDKEKQNIVVLQGTIGSTAEVGRTKGFDDTIKKSSNLTILEEQTGEFTQAKGQEVMESYLKKYKDIDIVVSQNDNMSFGAIDALKAAGKKPGKDVIIVSFDAVKAAFLSMIDGDLNASVECNPLHGPKVAELIKKIKNGETVDKVQYIDESVYSTDNAEAELPNRQY
ncbi:ABC transporter substrate-binding protein [Anaeromicropila herbilytica]|uniref:LacI family transcriptional regulator n=1 Tax=Anaeromicropila herbilytica TaxID=2785025 RepID=A0A7R7EP55_9FIRM|nr:ABC transporter substrate-binding protein [Anaeromicropila herbilytica]BCN32471.1 LacI family transcriptional regulator [Anaeromicropila herbilytica]